MGKRDAVSKPHIRNIFKSYETLTVIHTLNRGDTYGLITYTMGIIKNKENGERLNTPEK
jgi:hypothetical protein